MSNREVKQFQNVEVKAVASSEDGVKRFEGYLAYFDNVDSYGDVIVKGAFLNSLAQIREEGKYVPVLEQHGGMGINATDYTPVGYYEDLREDSKGLYAKGVLYDTQRGRDLYILLKQAPKGAMGQSIGFNIIGKKSPTEEEYRTTGVTRYLTEIKLMEGSIVTFPANDKARVEDVKMAEAKKRRALEDHFRENGFSASEAKKTVAILRKYEGYSEEIEEEKSVESETSDLTPVLDAVKAFQEQLEQERQLREMKKAFCEFPEKVFKG